MLSIVYLRQLDGDIYDIGQCKFRSTTFKFMLLTTGKILK